MMPNNTNKPQKTDYQTPTVTRYSADDIQAALGPAIAVY